jgi:two-component system cell cycle sensor histidine kinase PleC
MQNADRRRFVHSADRQHGHPDNDGETVCIPRDCAGLQAASIAGIGTTSEVKLRREMAGLRKALIAAEKERDEAVRKAESRSAFIASTSHELRTPLNAIIGFSEVLKAEMFGPLANDRYKEYADIIHQSGNLLLDLINDILDMSKLDAGKIEIKFARVPIATVISNCIRAVEPLARKSQVGISINLHEGIDCVHADQKRLHQMLLNLLSNAIKFTPEGGGVCISAFLRGEVTVISVSDTGIGLTSDDISKVLEPFGQVESDLALKHEGTGLGLPLTKELAELQGGTFLIESSINVGTTVTIELPTSLSPADAATGPRAPRIDRSENTMRAGLH